MKKRTMLFEEFNVTHAMNSLIESINGEISDIKDEVDAVSDELGKEGLKDDDVKAAILLQAIEKDGDLEKVDVEKIKKDIKEHYSTEGSELNEAAEGIIHTLELIGNFAGNADLIHFIAGQVEKLTGKKLDEGKVKETIVKVTKGLKTVTGLPAKALIKFFEWVSEKLGIKGGGAKAVDLVGRIMVLVFLFAIGFAHFPVLGTSAILWILSLTGLVGKSIEIAHLVKELIHMLKDKNAFKEKAGVSVEDMEAMIA